MIQMIQKPNAWLRSILFEGNSEAVDNFHNIIISGSWNKLIYTEKSTDNSFISLLDIDSIEVIDNGEENQWMDIGLSDRDLGHYLIFKNNLKWSITTTIIKFYLLNLYNKWFKLFVWIAQTLSYKQIYYNEH